MTVIDMNRPIGFDNDKTKKRTVELERVCNELYQVLGSLSDYANVSEHPDVQRALDNAARGRLVHRDLLPWPKTPLGPDKSVPEVNDPRLPKRPTDDVDAMSIKQFCRRHDISDAFFHKLQRDGKGPRVIKIGMRTLITPEAAAEWRRKHEAESAT